MTDTAQGVVSEPGDNVTTQPLGLYVHVPFCATKCHFCAFFQAKPTRETIGTFIQGIAAESRLWASTKPQPLETVFWGGGTPGVLSADDMLRLHQSLEPILQGNRIREWTVEMAPANLTPAKLSTLKRIGVTRISMGVQTFDQRVLDEMGRHHSPGQVMRAYEWIREAGFDNVNLDMIIAFPGQTTEDLEHDLDEVIRMAPDHVSAYCLTFEEDTPLYARLADGVYKRDIEQEAALYEFAWQKLEDAGFHQYEISNFSRDGFRSLHNLNTWRMTEWIGMGPSASSQFRGIRSTHAHDQGTWLNDISTGSLPEREKVVLNNESILTDCLIFGLRMTDGPDLPALIQRFGKNALSKWELLFHHLTADGLAVYEPDNYLRLTLQGRLVADAIGVAILEADDA